MTMDAHRNVQKKCAVWMVINLSVIAVLHNRLFGLRNIGVQINMTAVLEQNVAD